jgi:hypothetical protein
MVNFGRIGTGLAARRIRRIGVRSKDRLAVGGLEVVDRRPGVAERGVRGRAALEDEEVAVVQEDL